MERFLTYLLVAFNFLLVVSLSSLPPICGQVPIPYGSGQVWAKSDTLRPTADLNASWNKSGCEDHYQCVDEETPDGDVTKVYTSAEVKRETFQVDSIFTENIDSVVIRINAKKTGISTVELELGFDYYQEMLWYFHPEGSVTLSSSWDDYSTCSFEDENGDPWTYQKINARRFGVRTTQPTGIWSANVTQVFVIVYYQETEGGKKPGGIVQDEDNRGIAEGGIAR